MRVFKSPILRTLAASLILHCGQVMAANVIGQFDASFGFGYEDQPPPGFTYIVFQHDSDEERFVALRPSLFEDIQVTPATVGQQFLADATTDADFPMIVEHLTNGIDEIIQIWHFEGPGITGAGTAFPRLESAYLGLAGNPDLVGQSIKSMVMTVVDYRHDVQSPLGRFDYVEVTIAVIGVPEPSSLALVYACLSPLALLRSRTRPQYCGAIDDQ